MFIMEHGFGKGPYVLRWGGFCIVCVASLVDAWKGGRTCLCEQNQPLFCRITLMILMVALSASRLIITMTFLQSLVAWGSCRPNIWSVTSLGVC